MTQTQTNISIVNTASPKRTNSNGNLWLVGFCLRSMEQSHRSRTGTMVVGQRIARDTTCICHKSKRPLEQRTGETKAVLESFTTVKSLYNSPKMASISSALRNKKSKTTGREKRTKRINQ